MLVSEDSGADFPAWLADRVQAADDPAEVRRIGGRHHNGRRAHAGNQRHAALQQQRRLDPPAAGQSPIRRNGMG